MGCGAQILLCGLLALAFSHDQMCSTLAYMIVLAVPVLGLRLFLAWMGVENRWLFRLLGPVFMVLAAVLSFCVPLENDNGEKITPENVGGLIREKLSSGGADDGDTQAAQAAAPADAENAELPPVTLEAALAELDELVGLDSVKKEVRQMADFIKIAQERKKAGLKTAPVSYHMVFTGNPGTGKTTVARIMGKIFRALGVLKKGHLVETDRSGLVAGYVGQTAIKTNRKIDEALDGVLFIDEAYALAGEGKDYGAEAVAALLKRMEDERGRLIVIIAGYSHEMKGFMELNSGLTSRFNRFIAFPDYSARELAEIFRRTAKKNQYALSPDAEKYLNGAISLWTKNRDRHFGNGRYIRNLFEKAVERQATRMAKIPAPTREQLMTLTLADIGIKLKDPDASAED